MRFEIFTTLTFSHWNFDVTFSLGRSISRQSENLPVQPTPFCRESQWEISTARPPLPPLWVWYEIPENSFRNAKDSKRSRRWRVLCSEAPLSTKGLSLSLIPSSCKPELIVHGIGSIFYCSLKYNFWLSFFLQQVICYNWKILQLSYRFEKACLNLFCWFDRQTRYS